MGSSLSSAKPASVTISRAAGTARLKNRHTRTAGQIQGAARS
jgi:hypothetical protein